MSSTTPSPSWSAASLYSGHSWDKQEETCCAAVHGAVESNCPNSCQQPVTALGPLPQGSDSSETSPLCMSQPSSKTRYVHYGFRYTYKPALVIAPAVFVERIFTAMKHNILLQLKITAEKQVGSSAVSF